MLASLEESRRAIRVRIAGEERWAAIEDGAHRSRRSWVLNPQGSFCTFGAYRGTKVAGLATRGLPTWYTATMQRVGGCGS